MNDRPDLDRAPYEVIHARRVVDEVAPAVLAQDAEMARRDEHEDRLRRAGGEGR